MATKHQHRGYEIRKIDGRTPRMASSNGLNFSVGSTRYTEFAANVRYANGVSSRIARRRLRDVKVAIDQAIEAGHLRDKS